MRSPSEPSEPRNAAEVEDLRAFLVAEAAELLAESERLQEASNRLRLRSEEMLNRLRRLVEGPYRDHRA